MNMIVLMRIIFTICHSRYIATIDGAVNRRHLTAISDGTVIEGTHCSPDVVELLPPQPDISRPRIRIVVCWIYFQSELFQYALNLYHFCGICIQISFNYWLMTEILIPRIVMCTWSTYAFNMLPVTFGYYHDKCASIVIFVRCLIR